jgi:hypothetical protein
MVGVARGKIKSPERVFGRRDGRSLTHEREKAAVCRFSAILRNFLASRFLIRYLGEHWLGPLYRVPKRKIPMVRLSSQVRASSHAGLSIASALALVVTGGIATLFPDRALASCGDYVVLGDATSHLEPTGHHETSGHIAKSEGQSRPERAPCSGPQCRRSRGSLPAVPNAVPQVSHEWCVALVGIVADASCDSAMCSAPPPLLVVGRASNIFHPPRAVVGWLSA